MTSEKSRNRTRSPAYPSIGLSEAVERAAALYEREKRHAVSVDTVLEHWGYEPSSGIGMRVVAALKQYGLLEDEKTTVGRMVRLTRLAMDILKPAEFGSAEYFEALRTAASTPKLYDELIRKFGCDLPSDRALERFLELERNFNPNAVGKFIANFRDTLRFSGFLGDDTIDSENDRSAVDSPVGVRGTILSQESTRMPATLPTSSIQNMRELPVTLPSLNIALLRVPFPMTEEDFNALVVALGNFKRSLIASPMPKSGDEDVK